MAGPKEDTYIVYDLDTLEIKKTFRWFGREIQDYLEAGNGKLGWINRTHPTHKAILQKLKK